MVDVSGDSVSRNPSADPSSRYFVSALQTLFQAGFVGHVLLSDFVFLSLSALLFLGLTAWRTARRLD